MSTTFRAAILPKDARAYCYGALEFVEQTRGVENGDDNRAGFGDTRFWTINQIAGDSHRAQLRNVTPFHLTADVCARLQKKGSLRVSGQ